MPTPKLIEVTVEDITLSRAGKTPLCPLALALSRAYAPLEPVVDLYEISLFDGNKLVRVFENEPDVTEFVEMFDANGYAHPTTLVVDEELVYLKQ